MIKKNIVSSLGGWLGSVEGGGVGERANGRSKYEREVERWDRQA